MNTRFLIFWIFFALRELEDFEKFWDFFSAWYMYNVCNRLFLFQIIKMEIQPHADDPTRRCNKCLECPGYAQHFWRWVFASTFFCNMQRATPIIINRTPRIISILILDSGIDLRFGYGICVFDDAGCIILLTSTTVPVF